MESQHVRQTWTKMSSTKHTHAIFLKKMQFSSKSQLTQTQNQIMTISAIAQNLKQKFTQLPNQCGNYAQHARSWKEYSYQDERCMTRSLMDEAKKSKMQDEAPKRSAKTTARLNFLAPPTSIEVHHPAQIDVNDSDVFMEDNFVKSKSKTDQTRRATTQSEANAKFKSAQAPKNDGNATEREHDDKHLPRISDIQAQTNMNDVMNKIMKASVTMEVGEILRVSKEVAHQVAESFKPRSGTRANTKPAQKAIAHASVLAASLVLKAKGTLIKLVLECDGQTLNAILDTNSQLNIVNKKYWKLTVGHTRPTDITKQISMIDANRGEGKLDNEGSRVEEMPMSEEFSKEGLKIPCSDVDYE
ncbi:hypothetical protein EIP86_011590 [Pleurotus ostreatoroseus]|nr:hypothetical protein EIP86_011590 [Pleurotus ostreatoroseus]